MESIALVLDALLDGKHDIAVELLVRRMIGIDEAEANGHWGFADATAVIRTGSLLSEQHRRHFTKVEQLLRKSKDNKNKKDSSRHDSRRSSHVSTYRKKKA